MRKTSSVRGRKRRRRRLDEQASESTLEPAATTRQPERLGPQYDAGPVRELPARATAEPQEQQAEAPVPVPAQERQPTLEGHGEPDHIVAYTQGQSLRLQGRTDADFDGGSYRTSNVTVEPATGCAGCTVQQCVRCQGTLLSVYRVTTRVTLPSVSDYPGLTPSQQRRVQRAIDDVLAPHEQAHVRAFETYNGTTRRAFDLKLCRSRFEGTIQRMFAREERARRRAAQNASDALDPFYFDVDLDGEEERQMDRQGTGGDEDTPREED